MQFNLKNVLLIFALQLVCEVAFSQTTDPKTESEPKEVVIIDEAHKIFTKAGFPGGKDSLAKYLLENVHYPKIARKKKIEWTCFLTFTVTSFGNILDVKVARGVPNCEECDAEAIRVVKEMPQWIPAGTDDERSDSVVVLPITFKP